MTPDQKALAELIDGYCRLAAIQRVNDDRQKRGELPITNGDDYYVEPEYAPGQVEFLAEVVLEVLEGFGWVEPDWQGRWALFGEDFETTHFSPRTPSGGGERFPNPGGAYRMLARGGVPSFWRILCQAAVRKGWIDQSAAPEL